MAQPQVPAPLMKPGVNQAVKTPSMTQRQDIVKESKEMANQQKIISKLGVESRLKAQSPRTSLKIQEPKKYIGKFRPKMALQTHDSFEPDQMHLQTVRTQVDLDCARTKSGVLLNLQKKEAVQERQNFLNFHKSTQNNSMIGTQAPKSCKVTQKITQQDQLSSNLSHRNQITCANSVAKMIASPSMSHRKPNQVFTQPTTNSHTPLGSLIVKNAPKQLMPAQKSVILFQTQLKQDKISGHGQVQQRVSESVSSGILASASFSNTVKQDEESDQVAYPAVKTLFINNPASISKVIEKSSQKSCPGTAKKPQSGVNRNTKLSQKLVQNDKPSTFTIQNPNYVRKTQPAKQQKTAKVLRYKSNQSQLILTAKQQSAYQSQSGMIPTKLITMSGSKTAQKPNNSVSLANYASNGNQIQRKPQLYNSLRFQSNTNNTGPIKNQDKLAEGSSSANQQNASQCLLSIKQGKSRKLCKFNSCISKDQSQYLTARVPSTGIQSPNTTEFDQSNDKKKHSDNDSPLNMHLDTIESVEGGYQLIRNPSLQDAASLNQEAGRIPQTQVKNQKQSLFLLHTINCQKNLIQSQKAKKPFSEKSNPILQYKLPDVALSPLNEEINDLTRSRSTSKNQNHSQFIVPFVQPLALQNTQKKPNQSVIERQQPYNNQLEVKDSLHLRQNQKCKPPRCSSFAELKKLYNEANYHFNKHSITNFNLMNASLCATHVAQQEEANSVSQRNRSYDCQINSKNFTNSLLKETFHSDLKQKMTANYCHPLISTRQQHPVTVDQPETCSDNLFLLTKQKLFKQNSWQNKHLKQNLNSELEKEQNAIKKSHRILHSQLNSVHQSQKGSVNNLSLAKTEAISFQPSNPLVILRNIQAKQNYVWLAMYDEDILHKSFMRKISKCADQCLPWEFVPWRISNAQLFLFNENQLCLRREPGKETLCKIYLVHIDQVKDIIRYKNHLNDKKSIRRQHMLKTPDIIKSVQDLRTKYHVTSLKMAHVHEEDAEQKLKSGKAHPHVALEDDDDLVDEWHTMSISIPDERQSLDDQPEIMPSRFNFAITNESRRDYEDPENTPVLDLIYHEETTMGLPVLIATNRNQSKLDNSIPQAPCYLKHLKSLKPDLGLLVKMLQGLIQSFPDLTVHQMMYEYILHIPGIQGKLQDEEIVQIIQNSVEGVSIQSDMPLANLLTDQQTKKMFQLMQRNLLDPNSYDQNQKDVSETRLDPNDIQYGLNSMTPFNELNQQQPPIELSIEEREAGYFGIENSLITEQQKQPQLQDLSLNNQMIIDRYNQDFMLQQQFHMDQLQASGFKLGGSSMPGMYSSDTSQVDNFIFQNNINRLSNHVSQDYSPSNVTPQRDNRQKKIQTKRQGTSGFTSRNCSSHAFPHQLNDQSEKTSYQGACHIMNMQQPIFYGNNQWNNSGFYDQSMKEDDGIDNFNTANFKRGSSQALLQSNASPTMMPLRQLNSARKPAIVSSQCSQLVPGEGLGSNNMSYVGEQNRIVFAMSSSLKKPYILCSNLPSSSRSNAPTIYQPGYEIAVDGFDTGVESIRPLQLEHDGSAYQASNSLLSSPENLVTHKVLRICR